MKVIILAAGRGSRLGDRTKDRPKCMVEVFGKTILSRCLSALEQAGIERSQIGIVTGYRSDLFKETGVTYFHNENWEHTNMFSSLTKAVAWLEKETCLVCYSDIIFSPNAVKALMQDTSSLSITYYTNFWDLWSIRMDDPLSDLESFRIDPQYQLVEIGKKTQNRDDITGQYMGLLRFTPESWRWVKEVIQLPLPKPVEKLDMTTLLQAIIERGFSIHAIPTDDLWLECDTQEDIEAYEKNFQTYLEKC